MKIEKKVKIKKEKTMDFLSLLPKSAEITKLVIVGPYPSYEYVSSLIGKKGITKENLFLIVDDAWDVEELIDEQYKIKKVTSINSNGIVHAKMYYCCYTLNGVKKVSLIIGSANASISGMSVNAESLSLLRLSLFAEKERITRYFNSLRKGKSVSEEKIRYGLNQGSILFLPAIEISKKKESFASWLKSGYILYEYDRESTFGVVTLKLTPPLPSSIDWGETKFDKEALNSLRYKYVEPKFIDEKKGGSLKKYSVETCFGFWMSRDCYDYCNKRELFNKQLEQTLSSYVSAIDEDEVVEDFWNEIQDIKTRNLKRKDLPPNVKEDLKRAFSNNLKVRIRSAVYSKLKTDRRKASDPSYCWRYVNGITRNTLPRLNDEQWESFVESWFEYCMMKGPSSQSHSLLAKKVYSLVQELKSGVIDDDEVDTIMEWFLNKDWNSPLLDNGDSIKKAMRKYYLNKKSKPGKKRT